MKIEINNLSHLYDAKTPPAFYGIKDASFQLIPNGITAFIGHNGSGKTTLIKHLNALLWPTTGEVVVGENRISTQPSRKAKIKNINDYRKEVGFAFQFPEEQIFAETVEEEVTFGIKALKLTQDNMSVRVSKYLKLVGLDDSFRSANPFALSGGQKRMVALASILIMEQELLVLDEPTASLDTKVSKQLFEIIINLAQTGTKVIIVTHQLKNVLEYADEVVVFADGHIVAQGDPLDIIYNVELLGKYRLEVPKLVQITKALAKKNIIIQPTRTIDEFITCFENRGSYE